MVSLRDFVSETLVQIVQGAENAQKVLGNSATIFPRRVTRRIRPSDRSERESVKPVTHEINFDVQVIASSGTETQGNAGVKLSVFSAGTQGQSKSESQSVNRVQFSVPVRFDPQETTADQPE
jgi:hypothetical protein